MPADDIGLEDAYAVETPEDNRRLYAAWASSYDDGFRRREGYVYDRNVARVFVERGGRGPVLDIGCGTGAVGVALASHGIETVDGLDISPEMLEQAATKRVGDRAVYRLLMTGDLTCGIDMADLVYGGAVSAGTFTHGHVGPDAVPEVVRVGAVGAVFAIGVNARHYEAQGFAEVFDMLVDRRAIGDLAHEDVPIYENNVSDHGADLARVVTFTRR